MSEKISYGKKVDLALATFVKLARAYSTVERKVVDHARTFGLTSAQFAVIESLGHLGEMTIGILCEKMLVSGGNMTLVLDNLEKSGLIKREHSQTDRRAINIKLTQKGKSLFDEIFIQHAKYIGTVMDVITEDEQKQLGVLLKKLGLAVKKL
ncbi:MAG: MarR family transcriptional regulator [Ignavibacteria bacterium]|jgi:MarR family 2-MHQ and catechol resistance regulon transcriptional repressor